MESQTARPRRCRSTTESLGISNDSTCAAYCSDTLMAWTEGKYHLIIGVEAESKSNVIRVANSVTMQTDGNSL